MTPYFDHPHLLHKIQITMLIENTHNRHPLILVVMFKPKTR